jgi:hypothetical protein
MQRNAMPFHPLEHEAIRRQIASHDAYLGHVFGTIRDGMLDTDRDVIERGAHLERVCAIGRRRYPRLMAALRLRP